MNVFARWGLAIVTASGLTIDAYEHLKFAHNYRFNKTSTLSEADLFRTEAVLAIVAALLVLVWSSRWAAAIALAVAGGGLVLLLLYRYNNVGKIGPIPNMYEPTWDVQGKAWSVAGEAIAIVGSAALLAYSFALRPRVSAAAR
jgi:hypothetical protein